MSASPQIQVIWGQLEDSLRRFGERDPAFPHRTYEIEGQRAVVLCGELAAQVEFELAQYREHRTWGE